MARAQSHKIEYKDIADINTKIEFWEEGYAGSLIECPGVDDPLVIDIAPMDPNIFIPVIGKGATIKILSETNGQHKGLYTVDPVKRMVKIFKNDNANPWWLGYINAEQYSEPYSKLENYPVTINCNDGFNILNRYKYLNGTAKYTTLETMWTVLTRVLAKTGLPYQYIYFASGLSCDGLTPDADETLWHLLKVDQNNYYDEQDKPWTHRQVLEALLSPYYQIRQEGGSIFIYKPQMLYQSSFSCKRFNGTTYAYVDTVSVSNNFDISNGDINWDNEDQVFDVKSGFSKQVIRYSPYMREGAVKEIDVANRYLWTGTETWTADEWGILRLSGISAISGMTIDPDKIAITGHKTDDEGSEDIYLERAERIGDVTWLAIEGFNVGERSGQFLMITGEVYIKTLTYEFSGGESVVIGRIEIPMGLEVNGLGPEYYAGSNSWIWQDPYNVSGAFKAIIKAKANESTLADKWCSFQLAVPWNVPGGSAVLKAKDPNPFSAASGGVQLDGGDGILEVRMRNFKVRVREGGDLQAGGVVVNGKGAKEASNDDEQYDGELNVDFMNEAPEITAYHGDARNINDRAAIRDTNGDYTTGWRESGDASSYRLLDLVMRSIISQYRESLDVLRGTLEADNLMTMNDGPNFLYTLQDTDYLSTKKLLFTGGQYNDFRRTVNGEHLEIKEEDVTINVES